MSIWGHATITAICKQCGGYLTGTGRGTGPWDFRITFDQHDCQGKSH